MCIFTLGPFIPFPDICCIPGASTDHWGHRDISLCVQIATQLWICSSLTCGHFQSWVFVSSVLRFQGIRRQQLTSSAQCLAFLACLSPTYPAHRRQPAEQTLLPPSFLCTSLLLLLLPWVIRKFTFKADFLCLHSKFFLSCFIWRITLVWQPLYPC